MTQASKNVGMGHPFTLVENEKVILAELKMMKKIERKAGIREIDSCYLVGV